MSGLSIPNATATLSAPPAGTRRLYPTAAGWVDMNSAGTTTLLGGITGSGGAAGEVIFVGATPFETDPLFFWDDTNKRLGVGTATPLVPFHAYTTAVENAGVFEIAVNDHNPYNTVSLRRTRADTTPPNAGFGAGIAFNVEGFTSGSVPAIGVIRAVWEVNQTDDTTTRDSAMVFYTMLDNTLAEKMRLTSAGFLGVRETAPEAPVHAIFSAATNFVGIFENETNSHDLLTTLVLRRTRADGTAPNASFGTAVIYQLQGANDANVNAAMVAATWEGNQTDDTTARDSRMSFYTILDNTLAEKVRITSKGYLQVGGGVGGASDYLVTATLSETDLAGIAGRFHVAHTVSVAATAVSQYGVYGSVTITGTAPTAGDHASGLFLTTNSVTSGTVNSLLGIYTIVQHSGNSTVSAIYSGIFYINTGSSVGGAISEAHGVASQFNFGASSTTAVTTLYNFRAFASTRPSGTGTITTSYGIRVEAQAAAWVTNPYAIYQVGTTDFNYFLGKTWITNSTGVTRQAHDGQLNAYGGPSYTTSGWAKAVKIWTGHAIAFGADYNNPTGPYWGIGASAGTISIFYTTAQDASAAVNYMMSITTAGFTLAGGLAIGGPTGGVPGAGGINVALNVYKNNTAYTNPDYALEHWATGRIVKFAGKPGAKDYRRWTLGEVEDHIRAHYRLPRISDDPAGIFDMADIALEKIEELFTHLIELKHRVDALEVRQ